MTQGRLTATARQLRRNMTEAEKLLWNRLRDRKLFGTKFRRQVPVDRYVVDFLCPSARLVIELDGGQHAESSSDAVRTRIVEAHGYRVIRFWNHEVLTNIEGVLETIHREISLSGNLLP